MKNKITRFEVILFGVSALFFAFMIMLFLSSCSPERRATRKAIKANTLSPGTFAKLAYLWYPVKTFTKDSIIYKQGETVYKQDTITVDCDTVKQTYTKLVRIPCPPCPVRVDTFYSRHEETKESQSAVFAKQAEIDRLNEDKLKDKEKIAAQKKSLSIAIWAVIILGTYTLARWILRIWSIKLP